MENVMNAQPWIGIGLEEAKEEDMETDYERNSNN